MARDRREGRIKIRILDPEAGIVADPPEAYTDDDLRTQYVRPKFQLTLYLTNEDAFSIAAQLGEELVRREILSHFAMERNTTSFDG